MHKGIWHYLLAALLGLGLPLAFAPFSQAWLMPVLLAALMWLQYEKTPKQAFVLGWVFGLTGYIAGLHWIYISVHVYTGAPLLLTLFLILLLAAYLACFMGMVAGLASYFSRQQFWRWLVLYCLLWVLAEWLRGYLLTGFPWFALGYSQSDTLINGLSPIAGIFAMSLPLLLLAALPLAWRVKQLWVVVTPLLVLLAVAFWGQNQTWTEAQAQPVRVAIVQGNISQDQKWLPANKQPTSQRYQQLTGDLIEQADLIVWPEVAITAPYHEAKETLFRRLAPRLEMENTRLLAGVMRWSEGTGQWSNAVVMPRFNGKQVTEQFYDKHHLVPFAEYFPVPSFVRNWLQALQLPFSDLYTGALQQPPFSLAASQGMDAPKVAVSICFEDVFGQQIAQQATNAQLLVNVSNDAWFGRSIAAAQHEQIARLRALETQRWLVRATPTGYSAFINPRGEVDLQLPRAQVATAVAELQPRDGNTPYMIVRNQWLWLLLLVAVLLMLPTRKHHKANQP